MRRTFVGFFFAHCRCLISLLFSSLLASAGNSNATVIWIDQPSGTGFSFADSGDWGPFSEDEIADDVYAFLQGFFRQYPKYSKVRLEGGGLAAGRAGDGQVAAFSAHDDSSSSFLVLPTCLLCHRSCPSASRARATPGIIFPP